MKAEIRFDDGTCKVRITNMVTGEYRDFGPFSFSEADALIRDYDRMREMYLNG